MKTLELNQMENVKGDGCGMALALGGASLALAVFAPWSYLMMAGVAIDAIGMTTSCLY